MQKNLGITIDEHLDWKIHIDNLSNKIARNVGVLIKLKHFLPVYIMKTLYSSLIASHLQSCTLLWANSHVTNIRKLQLLPKKAIRIITSSHYIPHTDPLFSTTKHLKLDDLYKYQLGIFMHKITHRQLPQNMASMFLRTDNIHSHQLRNQNAYYIQQIRTNTRKSTINFSGRKFWNTLLANHRQLVSIHKFKKKFKALLLTKYSYNGLTYLDNSLWLRLLCFNCIVMSLFITAMTTYFFDDIVYLELVGFLLFCLVCYA